MPIDITAQDLRDAVEKLKQAGKFKTIKELCRLIHISPTTFSNYYNGHKFVSKTVIQKIKEKFGLDIKQEAVNKASAYSIISDVEFEKIKLRADTNELFDLLKHFRSLCLVQQNNIASLYSIIEGQKIVVKETKTLLFHSEKMITNLCDRLGPEDGIQVPSP